VRSLRWWGEKEKFKPTVKKKNRGQKKKGGELAKNIWRSSPSQKQKTSIKKEALSKRDLKSQEGLRK